MYYLLLDFDGVLFHHERFVSDLHDLLVHHGFSQEVLEHIYAKQTPRTVTGLSKTYFLLQSLEDFATAQGCDVGAMRGAVARHFASADQYLYVDAVELLSVVDPHRTFIITYGCPKWQEMKVSASGVPSRYGIHAYYTETLKSNIVASLVQGRMIDPELTCFADDTLANSEDVEKHFPDITNFWINRQGEVRYASEKTSCGYEAQDLRRVRDYIGL